MLVLEATRAAGHVQTLNAQITQLQLQLQEARETLVHERAVNAKRQEQQQKQQQEQQQKLADGDLGAASAGAGDDGVASSSSSSSMVSPRLKKSKSFFESLGFGSKD